MNNLDLAFLFGLCVLTSILELPPFIHSIFVYCRNDLGAIPNNTNRICQSIIGLTSFVLAVTIFIVVLIRIISVKKWNQGNLFIYYLIFCLVISIVQIGLGSTLVHYGNSDICENLSMQECDSFLRSSKGVGINSIITSCILFLGSFPISCAVLSNYLRIIQHQRERAQTEGAH